MASMASNRVLPLLTPALVYHVNIESDIAWAVGG